MRGGREGKRGRDQIRGGKEGREGQVKGGTETAVFPLINSDLAR